MMHRKDPLIPRWLSWMLVAVLLYLIYAAGRTPPAATPHAPTAVPALSPQQYPALAKTMDLDRWKRAINPDYSAPNNCSLAEPDTDEPMRLKVIDDAPGAGDAAECGSTITVTLVVWGQAGHAAFSGEVPLTLGAKQVAQGLDVGLLGMKPGGVRTLVLPPAVLTHQKTTLPHPALRKALPAGKVAIITATRVQ